MSTIDLNAFASTPLNRDPYDHLIVPGFVEAKFLADVSADFPEISKPGSFPLSKCEAGPAFNAFIDELQTPRFSAAFGEKFGLDLSDRPIMITVRGRCQAKDGQIHTDSRTKLITVLIYFNALWEARGGRLRVLRSDQDIEDYAAEVTPSNGTMLAFRRTDRSYHGHKPYVGERRSIQLNWVTGEAVVRREAVRCRMSAWTKRLNPFA